MSQTPRAHVDAGVAIGSTPAARSLNNPDRADARAGAKVTWFCDATCQRRSWKGGHKSRCPGLAEGYAAMKKELKDNKTALKDPGRTGA